MDNWIERACFSVLAESSWFHQHLSEMNAWNTWKIGIGPEVKRGMEVGRYGVTWGCAAHKGSFAPVNPSGFIEPHRAWHGIPATLLYAMHQNTGGSQPSWTIPGILTFPSPLLPSKLFSLNFDLHARENSRNFCKIRNLFAKKYYKILLDQ